LSKSEKNPQNSKPTFTAVTQTTAL